MVCTTMIIIITSFRIDHEDDDGDDGGDVSKCKDVTVFFSCFILPSVYYTQMQWFWNMLDGSMEERYYVCVCLVKEGGCEYVGGPFLLFFFWIFGYHEECGRLLFFSTKNLIVLFIFSAQLSSMLLLCEQKYVRFVEVES